MAGFGLGGFDVIDFHTVRCSKKERVSSDAEGRGAMRVRVCTRLDGARSGTRGERRGISSGHELHGPVDGHEAHAEVVDVVRARRAREAALGLGPHHQ